MGGFKNQMLGWDAAISGNQLKLVQKRIARQRQALKQGGGIVGRIVGRINSGVSDFALH